MEIKGRPVIEGKKLMWVAEEGSKGWWKVPEWDDNMVLPLGRDTDICSCLCVGV